MSGFSLLEDCGPPHEPKIQSFSPLVESLHHNLITHSIFSITISHPIFLPLPVKTLPQAKSPTHLKCPVSQLHLMLFGWLHEYIFAI